MLEDEGAEFAPKEIEDAVLPEDFVAETPVVEAEPEVEGAELAPAPITSEVRQPNTAMSDVGGAVQETPFRTQ